MAGPTLSTGQYLNKIGRSLQFFFSLKHKLHPHILTSLWCTHGLEVESSILNTELTGLHPCLEESIDSAGLVRTWLTMV